MIFNTLYENYFFNLRTHPQPLLLKREGAKKSTCSMVLKVPLFVREGFRESLLLLTQGLKSLAILQNPKCI